MGPTAHRRLWHPAGVVGAELAGADVLAAVLAPRTQSGRRDHHCFLPITAANVIFARRFRATADAPLAFGTNLLGAMLGGALEYLSLVYGYHALLVVAAALYIAAYLVMPRSHPSRALLVPARRASRCPIREMPRLSSNRHVETALHHQNPTVWAEASCARWSAQRSFASAGVLAARRRTPADLAGLWEFPGGKVEPGESGAGRGRP